MDTSVPSHELNNLPLPTLTPEEAADIAQVSDEDKQAAESFGKHRAESEQKFPRTRRLLGRVAAAAVCSLPVTSLALSDVGSVKILQVAHEHMDIESPQLKHAAENGIVGGEILLGSILEGLAITRSRRLKGASDDMDEYFEERRKKMSKPRKALSTAVNAPYAALGYVGSKIEKVGDKVATYNFPGSRVVGNLVSDTGKVNAIGTSGVLLQETINGNDPTFKRNTRLAALMTGSWIGIAEGVRSLYKTVPAAQPPLDWMSRAFEHITTPDNPYSATALGLMALGLVSTGWNVAKYHELKEQQETSESITEE